MTNQDSKAVSRRSFLKKGALAGGVAAGSTLAAPAVLAQAPIVVKMQTSWGASNIWDEFAKDYVSASRKCPAAG
jgi:TRAP-type mannitol/chloroaromatic compound transport system substrate-binding protein